MSQTADAFSRGATLFRERCSKCHTVDSQGPKDLTNLYRSESQRSFVNEETQEPSTRHVIWDHATLDQYLLDPKSIGRRRKVPFTPITKPLDREDLIAYLKGKSEGLPG
ncbi:unnamed protein product [Rhizoctonia solani]|uniref:Cytochrome c domain-containing protein n=1 Tax=Rhizoctonia solani TaxID=456999 RepID=A0A8H3CT91_9AGAM|nr:unnamed protein product [Rhizoctonia solani]CAE6526397.1 unnamed protein product [Rhizoctonia solani]